jgi:hypothetical protein
VDAAAMAARPISFAAVHGQGVAVIWVLAVTTSRRRARSTQSLSLRPSAFAIRRSKILPTMKSVALQKMPFATK